jgi:DNA invertase Pin-like site-specific DNA recombinase
MVHGYIRVSTLKQNEANQRFEILDYAHKNNITIDQFTTETISTSKKLETRLLSTLIKDIQPNDSLIITELSRLGRSLFEVMSTLSNLINKNVEITITKMSLTLKDDIKSKAIAMAFSLASEIEKELISSRTKEALAFAKSKGKKLGRPKGSLSASKLDKDKSLIIEFLGKGVSVTSMSRIFNVSTSTMFNYIKTRKLSVATLK